eukprot:SAG11_NODE_2952_length_2815_cov_4.542342_3_plen_215_part_00
MELTSCRPYLLLCLWISSRRDRYWVRYPGTVKPWNTCTVIRVMIIHACMSVVRTVCKAFVVASRVAAAASPRSMMADSSDCGRASAVATPIKAAQVRRQVGTQQPQGAQERSPVFSDAGTPSSTPGGNAQPATPPSPPSEAPTSPASSPRKGGCHRFERRKRRYGAARYATPGAPIRRSRFCRVIYEATERFGSRVPQAPGHTTFAARRRWTTG